MYYSKKHRFVKKTMHVMLEGVTHHPVSYYNLNDITKALCVPPRRPVGCSIFDYGPKSFRSKVFGLLLRTARI